MSIAKVINKMQQLLLEFYSNGHTQIKLHGILCKHVLKMFFCFLQHYSTFQALNCKLKSKHLNSLLDEVQIFQGWLGKLKGPSGIID